MFLVYLISHLCNVLILFQHFLDFLQCLVPLSQNSQRSKPNLKQVLAQYSFKSIF